MKLIDIAVLVLVGSMICVAFALSDVPVTDANGNFVIEKLEGKVKR